MTSYRRSKRANHVAFTLIELLVVVLILSILMAVALPLYLSAVSDSQRKTCRANMQTIANAVQATKVRTDAADYAAIITGGVTTAELPDLNAVPVCPNGGTYYLQSGNDGLPDTFQVLCTFAGHGKFQPGVDSN